MVPNADATPADVTPYDHPKPGRSDSLLSPEAVAVIGASRNPNRIGHRPIEFLLRQPRPPRIYPVNPRYDSIDGLTCYPGIEDVPGSVDVALVAVPAEAVVEAVRGCIAAKVRWVVVFSAGFAEVGPAGRRREQELRELAATAGAGTRIIGPNCIGVAHLDSGFIGSFTTAFDEGELTPGDIAIASQSGAFGVMIFREAQNSGIPVGSLVSTGNEVDFEIGEAIELLARQPSVRVILAYVEGLRAHSRFVEAMRVAREAGKAVAILKVGRSAEGAAAASSHTASMVGTDEVYTAAFSKHGVVRAQSMDHLLDLGQMLRSGRRTGGRRVGILTLSGGAGVLMTDEAVAAGLAVPRLEGATLEAMRQAIPAFGSPHNPVDFTAQLINEPNRLTDCIQVLCATDQVDVITIFLGNQARLEDDLISSIRKAFETTDKPIAVTWVGGTGQACHKLRQAGIPAYPDPGRCVRAVAGLVDWQAAQARADSVVKDKSVPRRTFAGSAVGTALTEPAVADLVRRYGIPVTAYAVATTAAEAAEITASYDRPVVMKVVSADILHKSDVGGVVVGVEGPDDAARTFDGICTAVRAHAPRARVQGVAVSPLETGSLELIVGVTWDDLFGGVVMVGAGGTLAEHLDDIAYALAPLSAESAAELLGHLRVAPVLAGARGGPRLDEGAVRDLLVRVGQLAANESDLSSLDMNPVLVRPAGEGVVVVDVKAVPKASR